MEEWLQAWLSGQPMPPNNLPKEWLKQAEGIAEHWVVYGSYRSVLEEWVSSTEAEIVTDGILFSGFCLYGQSSRVLPVPVMVRLLYTEPFPTTDNELWAAMRKFYTGGVNEWIQAHLMDGRSLRVCR